MHKKLKGMQWCATVVFPVIVGISASSGATTTAYSAMHDTHKSISAEFNTDNMLAFNFTSHETNRTNSFTVADASATPANTGANETGTTDADEIQLSLSDLLNIKVVTSSKSEESINDAPNVMYVITKEQIRRRGYKSLKDIFQIIPGFGVQHKDIQFVGQVRGIAPNDNEKFALMINGHIINQVTEPDYFQGGGFPLDNFERIEIIVGPGGVFYGGETLCAILNLITKKTNYNEVAGSFGSGITTHGAGALPNRDLQAMFGKKSGDTISFFASGSYYEHGGFEAFRENSANSSNAALSKMNDVAGRVLPSYNMFIGSDYKNWSAQFYGQNSQMPDLHMVSTGVDDARRTDYLYSGVIRNKHDYNNGFSSSLEINADHKRAIRALVKTGDSATGDFPNWDLTQTSFGGELAIQHSVKKGNFENFAQLGLQGTLKQHRHNYDFEWNPDKPYTFDLPVTDSTGKVIGYYRADNMRAIVTPSETHSLGLYFSDKLTINKYIKIVGAFRLDRDDILDNPVQKFVDFGKVYFSPRVALLISPFDKLHFKLMYNKATRLAQTPQGTPLNHLWGDEELGLAPDWATQNPNISKPEQLNTYEAQAMYYFGAARLTLNYWHQELKDYTSWYSPRTNVGEFKGNGFEYEFVTTINPSVSLWTNGALSSNDFNPTANSNKSGSGTEAGSAFQLPANDKGEVMAVPMFSANIGADLKFFKNLYLNPTIRYMTRQVSAAPVNVATKTSAGKDTTVVDFGYNYAMNKVYCDLALSYEDIQLPFWNLKMDARFILKNMLNNTDLVGTQWMTDSYHPEGLTWEVGLAFKF